jgi:hypothetical protein
MLLGGVWFDFEFVVLGLKWMKGTKVISPRRNLNQSSYGGRFLDWKGKQENENIFNDMYILNKKNYNMKRN